MFVSTRDQGAVRRSRLYGINKAARSSKLSVLSTSSAMSNSSTGSTATITQDSYMRSRDQSGRGRRKRKPRDETETGATREAGVLEKASAKEKKKRSVDVFDFLVEATTRQAANQSTADGTATQPIDDLLIESDPECYYRSHLSDSGVSMSSSNGDAKIPDSPSTAPLPTLMEDVSEHGYSSASSVGDCDCCQQESHLNWNPHPGTSYQGEQVPPSPATHGGFFITPNHFSPLETESGVPKDQQATGLITSPIIFKDKSTSRSTPRLFRRFKKINSRNLLQMQARIADLEHDIRLIDARNVSLSSFGDGKSSTADAPKASRPPKEEQARRIMLYQELRRSLDQYYQALIATHQVELITKPPTVNETQSFQKWIKSHIFNKGKASTLVNDEADLVCFKPPPARESPLSTFRIIALTAFLNVLVPLIFYKFMTGILNRLIIWSIIIASGAMTMENFGLKAERIYTTCIIAFGGISLGAALSL